MVEVAAIVAAQHPQAEFGMIGRVSFEELPQVLGHGRELDVVEDPVDAAVEAPDEFAPSDPLQQEHADAVDAARPQFGFDHQHAGDLRYARWRNGLGEPLVPTADSSGVPSLGSRASARSN